MDTAIRFTRWNSKGECFTEEVVHGLGPDGFTLCGVRPNYGHADKFMWQRGDWRFGVSCKRCLAKIARERGAS